MRILNLFLNYSCNAKCGFCFNPHDPSESEWKGISTEKAVSSLLDGFRAGLRSVSFIGGEPTVRRDLATLAAAARRIGFEDLRLVTNGLRLAEPGYGEDLVEAGLTGVDVSIHSHRPEIHDRLLGHPGAFAKAVGALAALKALPVRLGVNIVVNRLNYRELAETVAVLTRSHGVDNFSFFSLRYIGHMALPRNLSELSVAMSETAPFVRLALEVLEREGRLGSACLGDFTPCVLPGYEGLMTDWEAGGNPDKVSHPDGRVEEAEAVCAGGKRRVAACGSCVYGSRCLGVEGAYLSAFGDGEFRPLIEAPAPKARRLERLLS